MIRFIVLFLGVFASISYARIKAGEKVESPKVMAIKGKRVLVCLDSKKEKSVRFFNDLVPVVTENDALTLVVVDVNPNMSEGAQALFDSVSTSKHHIPDEQRSIYRDLDLIILPTLVLINEDHVVHSVSAGFRSNLKLFFRKRIDAFVAGEPPEDVMKASAKRMRAGKLNGKLNRAFRILEKGGYDVALDSYEDVLKEDAQHEEAWLGKGYALLLGNHLEDGRSLFEDHYVQMKNERFAFGYALAQVLVDREDASIDLMAESLKWEKTFHSAVYRAAQILEEKNRYEAAMDAYRRCYDIKMR